VHNFFPSTSENFASNGFSAQATDSNKFAKLQNPGLQFSTNKNASEQGEFENLGFVFGSNNSLPNESKVGKGHANKSETLFDPFYERNVGSSGMAFSLDSNIAKSEPAPSSKAGETSEYEVKYNPREEGNKSGFEKTDNNADFVFGSSRSNGNSVHENGGETNLNGGESDKCYFGGFASGTNFSNMKSNSKSRHFASKSNVKSKSCAKNAAKSEFVDHAKKNVDVETKSQQDKVNGSFVFGSAKNDVLNKVKCETDENRNGLMDPNLIFNISQKFQSMNITDSHKSDSHAGSDNHTFVFGSNKKNTDSSSSDQHKHGFQENLAEKIDEFNTKTNHERVFEFRNSEKKQQPVNLTEKSLNGTQYTETRDSKESIPSSYSSNGFSFQATPVDKSENKNSDFTGYNVPSFNTTNNLFSDLSKKQEFSANGGRSVRGKKMMKTKGKPKHNNKVHSSKEEENSDAQQNHQKSPESFSPMDFSPYQEIKTEQSDNKEPERRFSENIQVHEIGGKAQFSFSVASGNTCNSEEVNVNTISSSTQESSSTKKKYKKYKLKIGSDSNFASPNGKQHSTPFRLDEEKGKKVNRRDSGRKGESFSKMDDGQIKFESNGSSTLEACQSWRSRGNNAYNNGDLTRAEDFYTKGISVVSTADISGSFIEALVLCYSNRATTRLALGKLRECLEDCRRASSLNPNFLKVHIRAGNCHLLFGEADEAIKYFSKCLERGNKVCLDRRITIEAADGVQSAKKVVDFTNRAAEYLKVKTSDAADNALVVINEALSISRYSEELLELKGEALFLLRKYEEAIQFCERTLDFAEKNFGGIDPKNSCLRLWRWRLMSKSYFYLGKLDVALDFIEKQEQIKSIDNKNQESSVTLAFTIRELLLRKNAGNDAFQIGKHKEAIEHYTAAISSSVESRPFAAVCFCNRAAAHQSLSQITDAIADCSLSIALDPSYTKALSRRATLHEMIRDYEQAANDLQKLVSILEKQCQDKSQKSAGIVKDLKRTRHRLSIAEEKARRGTPLDLYMILGIKSSDSASEIKKAYRKAALRHHPDKAGQFLARCEIGDDGYSYKEIAEKVHSDADRLFKIIGEAYAILSDTAKRTKYDLREEMRDEEEEYRSNTTFGRSSNFNTSPFEGSSSSRRYYRDSWKTYGNSYSRW
jgi:DnaJ family protein C protein 7